MYMYMYSLYSILVFSLGLHIGHYDLGGSNEPIGSSSNLPLSTLCCDYSKITSSIRLLMCSPTMSYNVVFHYEMSAKLLD